MPYKAYPHRCLHDQLLIDIYKFFRQFIIDILCAALHLRKPFARLFIQLICAQPLNQLSFRINKICILELFTFCW